MYFVRLYSYNLKKKEEEEKEEDEEDVQQPNNINPCECVKSFLYV